MSQTAGQRARLAAKKIGRLQISAILPVIAAAARNAADAGQFHTDISIQGAWFLDKTNQRDLRRFLKRQDIFAVNPRIHNGLFTITIAWGDFPPGESLFEGGAPIVLPKGSILVINGTSTTGKAALHALREYRHLYSIKATSRQAPTEKLLSELPHVQWVKSDLSKDSLLDVTRGVDKIFYVMPAVEHRVQIAKDLVEALKANFVSYLVHISFVGAQYRSMHFSRQVHDSEQLFEASGVAVTHLRCAGWQENMLFSAQSIKTQSAFYQPWGNGSMALVSASDVGRAAAKLLTRMAADTTSATILTVDLTGPEALSNTDIARILSEELGRPITAHSPDIKSWVEQLKSYGTPEWFANGMGELQEAIAKGMASNVSPDGVKLLGRLVTFREFVQQNKAAFL